MVLQPEANPFAARYNGQKFVLMLPETGSEGARVAADRVRRAVENHIFEGEKTRLVKRITLSAGVAGMHGSEEHYSTLIKRAEAALRRFEARSKEVDPDE